MTVDRFTGLDPEVIAPSIAELVAALYPLPRSITGDAVRQSLDLLGRVAPLDRFEVPSGTRVLDWTVPDEWNLRRGWLAAPDGTLVADSDRCNLHVLSYSDPVHARLDLEELRPHLITDPTRPAHVPYRTSYYTRRWGICLSQDQADALQPGEYEVKIDATLAPGHLSYAESVLPGDTDDEILLFTHVCHPSLANDNCAGMAMLAVLMRELAARPHRHTIRAVFAPTTIGAITWLARNEDHVHRIRHGLVLSNVGDQSSPTYKLSRRGDTDVDRVAPLVLRSYDPGTTIVEYAPYGYDERQFCSPGFDLPMGSLSRSQLGYPEYHTSADDLDFVDPLQAARLLVAVAAIVETLDADRRYVNRSPKGEPQLGRHGLYSTIGGETHGKTFEMAMLWMLNQSDGTRSVSQIAERSGLPLPVLFDAATALRDAGLLAAV